METLSSEFVMKKIDLLSINKKRKVLSFIDLLLKKKTKNNKKVLLDASCWQENDLELIKEVMSLSKK